MKWQHSLQVFEIFTSSFSHCDSEAKKPVPENLYHEVRLKKINLEMVLSLNRDQKREFPRKNHGQINQGETTLPLRAVGLLAQTVEGAATNATQSRGKRPTKYSSGIMTPWAGKASLRGDNHFLAHPNFLGFPPRWSLILWNQKQNSIVYA